MSLQMYDIIKNMIVEITSGNTAWMGQRSRLALIGGIMINCDGEGTDMFCPLMFEVTHQDGSKRDLYEKVFGHFKENNPFLREALVMKKN